MKNTQERGQELNDEFLSSHQRNYFSFQLSWHCTILRSILLFVNMYSLVIELRQVINNQKQNIPFKVTMRNFQLLLILAASLDKKTAILGWSQQIEALSHERFCQSSMKWLLLRKSF